MRFGLRTSDLWTGSYDDRRPLSDLDMDENSHVHGRLQMCLGDRLVPHLGYFGADDVCLNTWMEELAIVLSRLGATETGEYTFDEGEQGQPGFRFARHGQQLSLSIVDSLISGGVEDKEWQDVTTSWVEFEHAVRESMESLEARICEASPEVGPLWWDALEQTVEARIKRGE